MPDEPLPGSLFGHQIFLQQIALTRLCTDLQARRYVVGEAASVRVPESKHEYCAMSAPSRSVISYLSLSYTDVPKHFEKIVMNYEIKISLMPIILISRAQFLIFSSLFGARIPE